MKFILPDVPVKLHLGVPEEERATEQEILVTLQWQCDTAMAMSSDDVEDTVDYFSVRECIQAFSGTGEWKLVEKFIADLQRELWKKFPRMSDIQLSVRKFPGRQWEIILTQ